MLNNQIEISEISTNSNPNRDEGRMENLVKKTMTTWTRRVTLGAIITTNLALGAAEPPKVTPSNDPKVSSASQWTLTTDDTHLNLSVANHGGAGTGGAGTG